MRASLVYSYSLYHYKTIWLPPPIKNHYERNHYNSRTLPCSHEKVSKKMSDTKAEYQRTLALAKVNFIKKNRAYQ